MTALRKIHEEIKSYHLFLRVLILLVAAGAAAALARFVFGLGATTNLNDTYPWGLWISFDVVTSVPLAAGAFVLGAIVHAFHIKKLEPLARPAILTGFLGYSLVCIGLILDLGQPHRAWHIFAYPNLHSPMFEVALCVMSYTTVATLEFLPAVCEKFGFHVPLRILRTIEVPLIVLGAAIATLHQSTIGTFFLVAVNKLHNLWYNPILPLLFWTSAVFTGMCLIIVEAVMVHRYLKQPDETELLATLTRIIPWFLAIYLGLKLYALIFLSQRPLFDRPVLTVLFSIEMILGIIVPLIMFLTKKIRTDSSMQLRAASMVAFFGLVLNRFNVSMFGMIQENQKIYYPSFLESVVTVGIIAAHVLFFAVVARYFPIFEHHPEEVDYTIPDHFHKIEKQPVPERAGS
ncbi:NrfD/PsrC family molybdoenzyme membrane anchor subunit [Syntrophorhabdus aromaticivorans]|jgi:Ni/Fe-hydrogenase subunit HybB-like protein|uniref:Ni/Fe-hydrogenase cytochrome b subunit n=1 Tax=Syntrophorhabdus aromaticivorans TaxID=328301 RepID=A0A351TZY9_9BACT|nr:Ni/Fe-hydrogenase cytochrome b subunit [Syntrophorhabdus aromaticivorans]NLW33979.1 Ni/Fe-hydrogenase cytochrome b subunit [Syntrophorhabdus aromaticivorans]HBA53270.1 Ni/Fe-hydrogenase cytochrome b subunit [Syntrophorhabdus aromaticivorans]